jgi:hypothetical protein
MLYNSLRRSIKLESWPHDETARGEDELTHDEPAEEDTDPVEKLRQKEAEREGGEGYVLHEQIDFFDKCRFEDFEPRVNMAWGFNRYGSK